MIDGEAQAKKKDPGPQHAYNLKFEALRPKTPHYVNMSTSKTKRFETAKLTKSEKNIGPTTYNTEKAFRKTSSFRMPINVSISGLAPTHNVIRQTDKLKVKQNRFLDQVVKDNKMRPSVG